MTRKMNPTERAARDVLNTYAREGLISRATVNQTIRQGLALAERTVRENYSKDQTLYYAGKIAEAREKHALASNSTARTMAAGRLMICEMYAAIYKVVQAERGDIDVSMEKAAEVMGTVREVAREARDEASEVSTPKASAA